VHRRQGGSPGRPCKGRLTKRTECQDACQ
jgi:hypothetical protein